MIYKIVKTYWKRFLIGILIAILPLMFIDNWLPYALLSHYNFNVDSQPTLLNKFNADLEDISFQTDDGVEISGWWIPAPKFSSDSQILQNPTLIVLHSLGGTRQDFLNFYLPIWQKGFNLTLIDMRGHGNSGGKYFTYGFHERKDISKLIDYLQDKKQVNNQKIAIMGISAGGTVAILSANYDKRIQALVSIAAFADLDQTITKQVPWLPLFWKKRVLKKAEKIAKFKIAEISPVKQIKKLDCPIFIVHGTADKYIPFINGQKLYDAAKSEKLLYPIKDADHSTMLDKGGKELQNQIVKFLQNSLKSKTT
ncbi:MAG: alpha/beta fold hydrolase [Cyanobacteria bacterium P01_A01_bin.45]